MEIPHDVRAFIESSFPQEKWEEANLILGNARIEDGTTPTPRLLRCVAFESQGNIQSLKHFASLLAIDWRDVIVAGECEFYDKVSVRVHDLTQPLQV